MPKPLRGWRHKLFGITLGVGHAVVLINASAYAAMEVHAASSFGLVTSYATWTQTDYMCGMAVGIVLAGWLGRRFGELRVVAAGFVVFALAGWLCGTTQNFYLFLAGRILLGLHGGITLPLSQALFLKEHPERLKTAAIAVWSIFTLAPAGLGPLIGGWFCDGPGWRWMFLLDVPIGLAVAAILWALLYGRGYVKNLRRFDLTGAILMVTIIFSFQTFINMATDDDWFDARHITGLLALGAAALIYFVVWERGEKHPILAIRLFAHRNFAVGVTCLVIGFLTIQGLLTFFVVQLQSAIGYPAFLAGLFYITMVVFAKPVANLFHFLCKRFDARLLATVSFLGFAMEYFWLSGFDRAAYYQLTFWPKLLEGACLGGFFVPLTAVLLHGIPSAQQGRAGELANMLRLWAGAIGIPTQTAIWYRRDALHQTHLVEHLSPLDWKYDEALSLFVNAGYSEHAAQGKLTKLITQQAQIYSINEVFWVAGCIFLGLAAFIWLARPTHLPLAPTPRQETRELAIEELMEEP
jgi:DHA2 family multidrug resistance protein